MNSASLRLAPKDKLATHWQFSMFLEGAAVPPIGVEISPSGVCQASCDFCFYANTGELGSHRNVSLDTQRLSDFLNECEEAGVKAITWTGGGEPTLHPDFGKLAGLTHSYCMAQGLFTNALAMPRYDPDLLEWIRITMTDKPYKVGCIKPLRACKTLGFAFNYAGTQDDTYLLETLKLAEEVKADYVQVRPALKFHGQTVDITPPSIKHPLLHTTNYKFADARVKHGYQECVGYHFVPFLWEDGNLDVCAYMRRHEGYTLGNIYKDSLKTILGRAPKFVPVHPNCQVCCKNHEINKAVHEARRLEDVDFP